MKKNRDLLNNKYLVIDKIGEGGFGQILQAIDWIDYQQQLEERRKSEEYIELEQSIELEIALDNLYALKKQSCQREFGVNFTTLREMQVLNVREVFVFQENIYLVLPLCLVDLQVLLRDYSAQLQPPDRLDIKTANFLFTNHATIKLCDFGLSKLPHLDSQLTQQAITLHYRAPEVLLGSQVYTQAVDIWGLGCVVSELFNDEQPVLKGTPENNSPLCELPLFMHYSPCAPVPLTTYLHLHQPQEIPLIQLIHNMLQLHPQQRPTAQQLLSAPIFTSMSTQVPNNLANIINTLTITKNNTTIKRLQEILYS